MIFHLPMIINSRQRTISNSVSCAGVGVHSGKDTNLTIKPAPANHDIKFKRTDLPDSPDISAHFNMVVDTSLATVIGYNGFIVSTIEHLMASFAGLSIDNALVEIDNYEMPIMDGSAGPFTALIKSAGIKEQPDLRCYIVIRQPIELSKEDKFVGIYPSSNFKITCTIDYDHPMLKKQSYCVNVDPGNFDKNICTARTFGFLHEYDSLKYYGLSKGVSLDNVIVIDKDNVINPGGLRFKNEFVRHKILDCLGDFSLLGMPILGHIITCKSGHAFNHAFLKTFFSRKDSWDTGTADDISAPSYFQPKSLAI